MMRSRLAIVAASLLHIHITVVSGSVSSKLGTSSSLESHQISCDGSRPKCFTCDQHDPPILFSTEESLNTHVNQHHDYRSRPCQRCPNAPGVLYHDINKWKRHQSKAHDDFDEPKHCSLRHEEERNIVETLYEHQNPPRLHLTQIHRESTKEINV